MSRLVVRDGRQHSSVTAALSEFAVLGEHAPKHRLAAARSVYVAVLESAGDARGWTKKELAARAGVSTSLLNEITTLLGQLGVLQSAADGSLYLGTALAAEPQPVQTVDLPPQERNPRAEKFWEVHALRVRAVRGGPPPRSQQQLDAAEKILVYEPDSKAILARLDFALGHRFYADKVLSMSDFARWWPKVSAAYLAEIEHEAKGGQQVRPEVPPARRVSYDSERVQVIA